MVSFNNGIRYIKTFRFGLTLIKVGFASVSIVLDV